MVGSAMMYAKMIKSWHTCFLIYFIFTLCATASYGGYGLQQKHVARSNSRIKNNDGFPRKIVKRNGIQDSGKTGHNGEYQGQRMMHGDNTARGPMLYTIQGNFTAVASSSGQVSGSDPNFGLIEFRFLKQNQGLQPGNNVQQRSPSEYHVEQGSPQGNYVQQRSSPRNYVQQELSPGNFVQQRSPSEYPLEQESPPGNYVQQRLPPENYAQQGLSPANFVQQRSVSENNVERGSPSEYHLEQGSPQGNYVHQRSPPRNYVQQGLSPANYLQSRTYGPLLGTWGQHNTPPPSLQPRAYGPLLGTWGQHNTEPPSLQPRSAPEKFVQRSLQPDNYVQQGPQPEQPVEQKQHFCPVCHYAQAVAEFLTELDRLQHNNQLAKESVNTQDQEETLKNLILKDPFVYRQYLDIINRLGKMTSNEFDEKLYQKISEANLGHNDPFTYKQLSGIVHDGRSSDESGQRSYEKTKNEVLDFRNPLLPRHNSNLDICHLEVTPGPCKAAFPRFYYNSVSKQCETFVYGGCDGNANNFFLKEECESFCMGAKRNFTSF